MKKQKIIIPIDFTTATENALIYAKMMAASADDELILFHVLDELNEITANAKLNKLKSTLLQDYAGTIITKTVSGKVSEQIGKSAEALDADFIVMGIHKNTRFESLFGSNAVQVISKSKVPFIVVQDGTNFKPIKTIAMTIDLERESTQIVKIASKLSMSLNCELILVAGDHTDPEFKTKVKTNLIVALDYLKKNNIKSEIVLLDRKEFTTELITLCKNKDVQMLAATYYTNTFQLLSPKFVQNLLSNDLKIPVLTIDAQAVSSGSQFSFISV